MALSGAVVALQDITARKSLEQEKNAFLSLVSHELRTPLTAMQGYAELLPLLASRGEPLDGEPTRRVLDGLFRQSERLASTMENWRTKTLDKAQSHRYTYHILQQHIQSAEQEEYTNRLAS